MFHTDTAQSIGYLKMDYDHSDIDMVSLTAEKVCGPKGVGALCKGKKEYDKRQTLKEKEDRREMDRAIKHF